MREMEDSLGRRRAGDAAEATVPRSASSSIWQTLAGAGSALVGAVSSTLATQPDQRPNRNRASAFALGTAPKPAVAKQKMLRRRDLAEYIVESGDTLAGLALRFRTKVRTLKRCNPSIMETLFPGQVIRVPDGEGSPVPAPSPSPTAPPPLDIVLIERQIWFCAARRGVALRKGTLTLRLDSVVFVATRGRGDSGKDDGASDFDFVLATSDITDCGALSHTHHTLGDAAGGAVFGVSPSELPVQSRAYLHILVAPSAPMAHEDLFLLLHPNRVLVLVEALKEQIVLAHCAAAARARARSAAGARAKAAPPPPVLTSPPAALPARAVHLFARPRGANASGAAAPSAPASAPPAPFVATEADAAMLVPLVSPKLAPREAGAVGGAPPLCAGAAALPVLVRLPRLVSRGALFVSDVVSVADVGDIEDALPWAYKDHDWELVYSLHTHGSTLETFLTNASREAPTLLLLRSAHDEVCGVFASEAWQYSARFRGSGETFIFKCRDRATAKSRADSEFRPYRWCVVVPATSVLRRGRA